MSTQRNPGAGGGNKAGCCAGPRKTTPMRVSNRPGLSAIAYRTGTWSEFYETMLARLSSGEAKALDQLRTRDKDDFAIALLDAWSVVSDVMTFYQERFANESYIRSSRERRSLVELARLVGYQPSAGVAAEAWLSESTSDRRSTGRAAAIRRDPEIGRSRPGSWRAEK